MANLVNPLQIVSTQRTAFLYDFAKDGGAIGTLVTPVVLPAGVAVRCRIVGVTTVTSAGAATIDVTAGGTTLAVVSPTAKGDIAASNKVEGLNDVVATTGANATAGVVTGGGVVSLVIGAAAITAGKFFAVFEYDVIQPVQ